MNIGEKIKNLRTEKGMTQKELSKLSGIAEITIRKYENHDRQPKVEQVQKLAAALKVTPFDIMGFAYFDDAMKNNLINDINNQNAFISYLEFIGYKIKLELNEVLECHEEDMILNGEVIGKDKVIDNATYNRVLTKEGKSIEFNEQEFIEFMDTIERSVEFEIFKASQKK